MLKQFVRRLPIRSREFRGSTDYWVRRYRKGRNSGGGSYGRLAEFKAKAINEFVETHNIEHVIEFGCGDGNQLTLATYPSYHGFDISPHALDLCRSLFANDDTRRFSLMQDYQNETAPLTLSLDVLYHLVEDDIFDSYMRRLFAASTRHVIIYSSNTAENPPDQGQHVRHRCFTDWVIEHMSSWELKRHLPNAHPYEGDVREGSTADFYFYQLKTN
ncbi:MAG: class I SAM-dependent methyltransferase [Planctomycetaceae bacterium]|nr:class I SAM-dependent methyltransferase [Planctomycetaceae bacterium]